MVKTHKFKLNNKNIVLDIHSGSVHVVDDIIWDIVDEYESKKEVKDIIGMLGDKYSKADIEEAISEIESLRENGLIYSEEPDISGIEYNKDGVVKALCLHVAHDCNLKCNYCFASQGDFDGEKLLMSSKVGKKALDFLVENSGNRRNLEVDFFGGEPLMNMDVIKEVVEYGEELEKKYDKNFRFTTTTNGVLLNSENMDYLNEKMENVVLSLDGRKEINDNMRPTLTGEGSYDIIVPKFLEFVELRGDRDYYIRGTFTSKNLDFAKDLMSFRDKGFESVSIEPVVTTPDQDYAILEEHLDTVLAEYEKLSKEYIDIKKSGEKFNFFHFMIDLTQGPCFVKRIAGCGAGVEYLAVTPEGDLYPCHQFVGDEDFILGDLDSGVEKLDIVDKFRNANVFTKDDCKSCWAKYYCSGGCHANAYNFNKDINKPYEIGCEMEKKRIECAISIEANLAE